MSETLCKDCLKSIPREQLHEDGSPKITHNGEAICEYCEFQYSALPAQHLERTSPNIDEMLRRQ